MQDMHYADFAEDDVGFASFMCFRLRLTVCFRALLYWQLLRNMRLASGKSSVKKLGSQPR